MQKYFQANINIQNTGGVVASPDHNTGPGGDYYYHWARDGALSMNALHMTTSASTYTTPMNQYVQWVVARHQEQDPNNIDVRVEPKYELPSGNVFTGGWCRPQNDGPGLRAITLITYANELLKNGSSSIVSRFLWTGSDSANQGGAIKYDLDWVAQNWQSNTCDLWEEVQSNDFFWNRYTMRKALFMGADFATKMQDSSTASTYLQAAKAVNATIYRHYNGNFVFEADNRQQDAAVICAFNDGAMNDGFFAPTSVEVANTISTYNKLFHDTFPINQADDANNVPGILYGRYQGDNYDGGNPWILTSGCLAQLYYRGATEAANLVNVHPDVAKAWHSALNTTSQKLTQRQLETPQGLSKALASAGDGVLLRIRYHTQGLGFHMPEQIDKNSGDMTSATDLTWSYATILKAMMQRQQAVSV